METDNELRQQGYLLAIKVLGFDSPEDYHKTVAKVPNKKSLEFKQWETENGTKGQLLNLLEKWRLM